MPILRDNNKMPEPLQSELASYGLMRQTAKENAPKYSGDGPNYFGIAEDGDEFKLYFTNDLRKIENQDDPMRLAIVAPDHTPFDMLEPKDYSQNKNLKDESAIRRLLSNLLDTL